MHNGIDPAEYVYSETKEDYLPFMAGMQGPTVPDMYRAKGLEDALGAARETGIELVVAGTTRERAVGERSASCAAPPAPATSGTSAAGGGASRRRPGAALPHPHQRGLRPGDGGGADVGNARDRERLRRLPRS